jgi:hypothetical protein
VHGRDCVVLKYAKSTVRNLNDRFVPRHLRASACTRIVTMRRDVALELKI